MSQKGTTIIKEMPMRVLDGKVFKIKKVKRESYE